MNKVVKTIVIICLFILSACPSMPVKRISYNEIQADIELSAAALASYSSGFKERSKILQQEDQKEKDYFGRDESLKAGSTTEFLVTESRKGYLILSFTGTNFDDDWSQTRKTEKRTYLDCPYDIHSGYLETWLLARDNVIEIIKKYDVKEIRLSGHSKGGSVATIATYELLSLGYNVKKLVTFGAPPIFHNLGTKTPRKLEREINENPKMARLNAISTHYLREGDFVQEISKWWFQSSHNFGTQRIIKNTGYIETQFFTYPPYKEYLGNADPLASTDLISVTNHEMSSYHELLIMARDHQYIKHFKK